VYLNSQVSLTTGETLQSKKFFEQFACTSGICIKSYRADNVPFGNTDFRSNIQHNDQMTDFSGVGAHHQSEVAEQAIQTITSGARTMMLHLIIMWPDQANPALWPFALEQVVYLWNSMPQRESQMAPVELFYWPKASKLQPYAVFTHLGMPHLCLGPKIARWQEDSKVAATSPLLPVFGILKGPLNNYWLGFEYCHWAYFTTVPCCLR
jgi:hypothetical protein